MHMRVKAEMADETEHRLLVLPKDINFDSLVIDIDSHPSKDVIVSGLIEGEVLIYSYSCTEENHQLMSLDHHKKSCRAVKFSPDGDHLYTASKDKSVCQIDVNAGTVARQFKKAHSCPVYSMLVIDEHRIATGDDDGTLKVWDMRHQDAVMEVKENDDYISGMVIDDAKKILVATSGDGTLTAINIKNKKMELQSELFDSEMLSISKIQGGDNVVVGDGEGVLDIFKWGEWGNISDRFPGHPQSIDCIQALSDNIVCTGSMDGIIRAVHILPNRFLGTIGEHADFPVENLSLSHDKRFLTSCSHDQTVKFWDVSKVVDEAGEQDPQEKPKKYKKNKKFNKPTGSDFFAGLAGAEEN